MKFVTGHIRHGFVSCSSASSGASLSSQRLREMLKRFVGGLAAAPHVGVQAPAITAGIAAVAAAAARSPLDVQRRAPPKIGASRCLFTPSASSRHGQNEDRARCEHASMDVKGLAMAQVLCWPMYPRVHATCPCLARAQKQELARGHAVNACSERACCWLV